MKSSKLVVIGASLAAAVAVWLFASPYMVLSNIKDAAQARDGEKLVKYVEFEPLRQSMKEQIKASMAADLATTADANNPLTAFGAGLGLMFVDNIVDAMVTPSGLIQLINGEDPMSEAEQKKADRNSLNSADYGYAGISTFKVTITDPKSKDETHVMLRRKGFSWAIYDIKMPL